jgi:hypothetical protein
MTNAIEALVLGLPYEVTTETALWHRKGMALQGADKHHEALEYFESCVRIEVRIGKGPDSNTGAELQTDRECNRVRTGRSTTKTA